jgi:hypothetical protein
MRKNRRWIYIVEPWAQFSVAGYLVALSILSLAAIYWGLNLSIHSILTIYQEHSPKCSLAVESAEVDLKALMNSLFVLDGFAITLFSILGSILITHRIVGPIYKLKKLLRMLRDGHETEALSMLRFREHDFFHDLTPLLQELIQSKLQNKKDPTDKH